MANVCVNNIKNEFDIWANTIKCKFTTIYRSRHRWPRRRRRLSKRGATEAIPRYCSKQELMWASLQKNIHATMLAHWMNIAWNLTHIASFLCSFCFIFQKEEEEGKNSLNGRDLHFFVVWLLFTSPISTIFFCFCLSFSRLNAEFFVYLFHVMFFPLLFHKIQVLAYMYRLVCVHRERERAK